MVFFAFPKDARWDTERASVEFTVLLGEHQGDGSRGSAGPRLMMPVGSSP